MERQIFRASGLLGFEAYRTLQRPLQYRRGRRRDSEDGHQGKPHHNPTRDVVFSPHGNEDVDFRARDESDQGDRAASDGSQPIHGDLRNGPGLSKMCQKFEHPMERDEKRGGAQVHVGEEGILEVDLKDRGMGIPALDMGLPQQKGDRSEPDAPDGDLKENCGEIPHG